MCLIIDTNTFASVFNEGCQDHEEFSPVKTWIMEGKGKAIFGGSTYRKELKEALSYLKLFNTLKDIGKACEVPQEDVDEVEIQLKQLESHRDFDDAHIVAIAIVSKINLICSKDSRSHPFLKDRRFYPKGMKRPKIYTGKKNASLLTDKNAATICRDCP